MHRRYFLEQQNTIKPVWYNSLVYIEPFRSVYIQPGSPKLRAKLLIEIKTKIDTNLQCQYVP